MTVTDGHDPCVPSPDSHFVELGTIGVSFSFSERPLIVVLSKSTTGIGQSN